MKKILMAAALAAAAFVQAEEIKVDGSTTVGPIFKAIAETYMKENPEVRVTVSESGSGNGAKSLINKACEIAMLSRPLKIGETKAALEKNIQPFATPIAYDAVVMITHPSNPVKNLSVEQVRGIYAGTIKNWKEVGGADMPILVITRDANSGTAETFTHLVMGETRISSAAEVVGSNGAARQRIQTAKGAIAYIGIGYIDRTIKPLQIESAPPEATAILTGAYKLSRPLFIYTADYPTLGSHLFRLCTYHLTPKGQEIIEAVGFIPVTQY